MDRPVFFGDNLFSIAQYPNHVISASEEPVGHEAALVANGRRWANDYATATTANNPWYLQSVFDRLRGFNMMAIDKGSNLFGARVQLLLSDDGFVNPPQTVLDLTIPAQTGTGSLDDAYGVRTEDGPWLIRFPFRAGSAIRVNVPAMGVGLKPQVVGCWVGLAYSPAHLYRPTDPDNDLFIVEETVLPSGARSRGRSAYPRQGAIRLKMADWFEYETARYHLHYVFGRSRPTWIIHDEDQADRALLADRAGNTELGLAREAGANWIYPQGSVQYVERVI